MRRTKISPASFITYVAIGGLMISATGPAVAQHPNHPLGLDPSRQLQGAAPGIDQVDLFSGNLTMSIPIGPFALVYNSNVWRYQIEVEDDELFVHARTDRRATAGMGWHLGWGEVYSPTHHYNANNNSEWLYVDENGARHYFRDRKLHHGDGGGHPDWLYSRDGSYMRFHKRCVSGCQLYMVTIEFPDGTTRLFDSGTGGHNTTYHLHKVWGPHASEEDPDLVIEYDREDPDGYSAIRDVEWRTVTDRAGRVHRVTLASGEEYPKFDRVVTEVDLETFGGQRTIYTFEYENHSFTRNCKDDWDGSSYSVTVPVLTKVLLPGGGVYEMADAAGIFYDRSNCNEPGSFDDQPAVLTRIRLPTGGGIGWTYQEYEFPPGPDACAAGDTSCVFNTSAGVLERRLIDHQGNPYGNPWHYRTSSVEVTGEHPEIHTEVALPDGRCNKHYFDAVHDVDPVAWDGWQRALPFVYSADDGDGKYLSSEVYDSHDGDFRCSGSPLRSTYVRYQFDEPPGGSELARWTRLNQRRNKLRTVYHLDGDRYKEMIFEEFNGVGGYRRTITRGDFLGPASAEERVSYVHTDAARGQYSYPFNDFVPVPTTERWLFGLHDYAYQEDLTADGGTAAQVDYQFEEDGFPRCSRELSAGTATAPDGLIERSANDVVTVFERYLPEPSDPEQADPYGQIGEAKLYGGDTQPLPTSGPDCGIDTAALTPAYWTAYEYEDGSLSRSFYVDPADPAAPPAFYTYDADIDPSSGLVATLRDASGYEVEFDYDAAGRLIRTEPEDGAFTTYEYRSFGDDPTALQAKVTSSRQNVAGVLSQGESELDDFGRAVIQRRMLPDGSFSARVTGWDPQGRLASVSEWGDPSKVTRYLDYDPVGRVRTIRPPDGPAHDVTIAYTGDRRVTTSTMRGSSRVTDPGGNVTVTESAFDRTSEFDSHGRLRSVFEPSGPAGADIVTTYGYDVGGRLTEIVSGDDPATVPVETTQTRSFSYDQRGMLLSESHPEVTGPVVYSGYDALGLYGQRDFGQHSLRYARDFLGRLRTVTDANNGDRLVTELAWDRDDGLQAGRDGRMLWIEQSNYIDEFPEWPEMEGANVQVRHLTYYEGLGSAESRRDTRIRLAGTPNEVIFRQDRTYTDLGQLETLIYPHCIASTPGGCAASDAGVPRTVTQAYQNGWLAEVVDADAVPVPEPWASISYHDSGAMESLAHRNGVVEHFTPDPSYPSRPQRIHTTGVIGDPTDREFDSGTMTYDGAGNLKSIGEETFTYDGVGRLASYAREDDVPDLLEYDRFGNLTAGVEGLLYPDFPEVDPATNRFATDATTAYDDAGNLLRTRWLGEWRYDTQNRVKAQNWLRYAYDGFGERTVSLVADSWIFHLRDPGGRLLDTALFAGNTFYRGKHYIYSGSRLLADHDYDWGQGTRHYHLDHLGNTRVLTDPGGYHAGTFEFAPYGWEPSDTTITNRLFTGHERDGSTRSDYMHARHYHSHMGRFLSVDPLRGNPGFPQSLNRFAYVTGNPINLTDPTGLRGGCGSGEFELPDGTCRDADYVTVITVYSRPSFGQRLSNFLEGLGFGCQDGSCGNGPIGRDDFLRETIGTLAGERPAFWGLDLGGIPNSTPPGPAPPGPPIDPPAPPGPTLDEKIAVGGLVVAAAGGVTTYVANKYANTPQLHGFRALFNPGEAARRANVVRVATAAGRAATLITYGGVAISAAAVIDIGITYWIEANDAEIQSLVAGDPYTKAQAAAIQERARAARASGSVP